MAAGVAQGCKGKDGNPLPLHKSKAAKVPPKREMNDCTAVWGVGSPTEGAAGVEEWLVLVGWVGQ